MIDPRAFPAHQRPGPAGVWDYNQGAALTILISADDELNQTALSEGLLTDNSNQHPW